MNRFMGLILILALTMTGCGKKMDGEAYSIRGKEHRDGVEGVEQSYEKAAEYYRSAGSWAKKALERVEAILQAKPGDAP